MLKLINNIFFRTIGIFDITLYNTETKAFAVAFFYGLLNNRVGRSNRIHVR